MNQQVRFVVFTENTALIVNNPDNWQELLDYPNAIADPDLAYVKGIPPHLWKKVGQEVVQMSEKEKAYRLKSIKEKGFIKDIKPIYDLRIIPPAEEWLVVNWLIEFKNRYAKYYRSEYPGMLILILGFLLILVQIFIISKK